MSAFHCCAALVKSLSLGSVDVMTVRKNIHHKRSGEWTIFFRLSPSHLVSFEYGYRNESRSVLIVIWR
jgi:hypothetical protein